MRIIVWSLVFGLLLPMAGQNPSHAGAQSSWDAVKALEAGAQIRILRTGGRGLSGQFESADDWQIVLSTPADVLHIPRTEVQQVGLIKSDIRRRTLIGLAVGVGFGVLGVIGAGLGGRSTVVPALLFPVTGSAVGRLSGHRDFVVVFRNRMI